MSWTSCMEAKIVSHYGPEVKDCVDGITKGDFDKIINCMVTVLGITDPEVWIPIQLGYFATWSVECEF